MASKTPVVAICMLSIACGIAAHLLGFQMGGPQIVVPSFNKMTANELRAWLHIDLHWGGNAFDKSE